MLSKEIYLDVLSDLIAYTLTCRTDHNFLHSWLESVSLVTFHEFVLFCGPNELGVCVCRSRQYTAYWQSCFQWWYIPWTCGIHCRCDGSQNHTRSLQAYPARPRRVLRSDSGRPHGDPVQRHQQTRLHLGRRLPQRSLWVLLFWHGNCQPVSWTWVKKSFLRSAKRKKAQTQALKNLFLNLFIWKHKICLVPHPTVVFPVFNYEGYPCHPLRTSHHAFLL